MGRMLLVIIAALSLTSLAACGGDQDGGGDGKGACIHSPLDVDFCYNDYERAECEENSFGEFHDGKTCAEIGLTKKCHNSGYNYDYYVWPSDSCVEE